jgi:hypothetical protein
VAVKPGSTPLFWIGLIVLASCAQDAPKAHRASLEEVLPVLGIGMDVGKDRFEVDSRTESKLQDIQVRMLGAHSEDGRVLRIERLSGNGDEQARSFIESKTIQLHKLFVTQADPYFASNKTQGKCPTRFRLSVEEVSVPGVYMRLFSLYANDRLALGACDERQAAYHAVVGVLHCRRSNNVYVVEDFIPTEKSVQSDSQPVRSMMCLN